MHLNFSRCLGTLLGLLVWSHFLAAPACAQDHDPPSRVARLAYAEGSVSFQPSGTDDWAAAPINRPLTTGDKVWSDRNSRVELQLDGSLVRLSSETSMALLNLDNHVTQIQLSSGTLIVHVRRLDDDETYEIDTPNLAFSPLRPGVYRLMVDGSGNTTVISVRSGQGEVTGGGSAYTLGSNQSEAFSGSDQLLADRQNGYPGDDSFDDWSFGRDARADHSESARYVSPDVVGYEDLDEQGDWMQTSDYGEVWIPRGVEAGWAPYHDGHWAYVAPWGYTWVDDQSWGFAPFHYGRWVSWRGSWGWVPCPPRVEGVEYVRPVYAPALVAWVGVGAGVAWFALGPREVYVPSYPVSRGYVDRINISNTRVNTTVINNIYNTTIVNNKTVNVTNVNYINRSVPGAVAATTTRAFTSAQPVARNFLRFDQRNLEQSRVNPRAPAVVPSRQAVLGSGRSGGVSPPAPVQSRVAVARLAPPSGSVSPVRIAPAATPTTAPAAMRPALPPNPGNGNHFVHPNEVPAMPPASPGIANTALERQHLQDQQRLQSQQDAERARLQHAQDAQHAAEQQRARQQAEQQAQQVQQAQARQRELEAQHAQQTQQLMQQQRAQQEQQLRMQEEQRQQQQQQLQQRAKNPAETRPPHP